MNRKSNRKLNKKRVNFHSQVRKNRKHILSQSLFMIRPLSCLPSSLYQCLLTAEIVEIELDVMRNNIMRFELLLSISAFTVSLGALVTGEAPQQLLFDSRRFGASASKHGSKQCLRDVLAKVGGV